MDSFMRNATSNSAGMVNPAPGMNTMGGGAAYARNAGCGNNRTNVTPGQTFVPGQFPGQMPGQMSGQSNYGQMGAPGQGAVPGQVPGLN